MEAPSEKKATHVKFISWNVNGIQGLLKKGPDAKSCGTSATGGSTCNALDTMLMTERPDIVCLQEIRCSSAFKWEPKDYPYVYAHHCDTKAGYSGTLTASKIKPLQVSYGLEGITEQEGRAITAEFDNFILVNVYSPNTMSGSIRTEFRLKQWEPALRNHVKALQVFGKGVIICGDLNVIPTDNDMLSTHRVGSESTRLSGSSEPERENFFKLIREYNLVDSFRYKHRIVRKFSWRAGYMGARIDFFLIPSTWTSVMTNAEILEYRGSDHVPIVLELEYTT